MNNINKNDLDIRKLKRKDLLIGLECFSRVFPRVRYNKNNFISNWKESKKSFIIEKILNNGAALKLVEKADSNPETRIISEYDFAHAYSISRSHERGFILNFITPKKAMQQHEMNRLFQKLIHNKKITRIGKYIFVNKKRNTCYRFWREDNTRSMDINFEDHLEDLKFLKIARNTDGFLYKSRYKEMSFLGEDPSFIQSCIENHRLYPFSSYNPKAIKL